MFHDSKPSYQGIHIQYPGSKNVKNLTFSGLLDKSQIELLNEAIKLKLLNENKGSVCWTFAWWKIQ